MSWVDSVTLPTRNGLRITDLLVEHNRGIARYVCLFFMKFLFMYQILDPKKSQIHEVQCLAALQHITHPEKIKQHKV